MTDEPFRRPSPDVRQLDLHLDVGVTSIPGGRVTGRDFAVAPEPIQEVWALPDDGGDDPCVHTDVPAPDGDANGGNAGQQAWALILAAVLASISLVAIPHLLETSPQSLVPAVVEDMPGRPEIPWSAEGGQVCGTLNDHDVVLSRHDRVWSLDLRSGETKWSVDLTAQFHDISCLEEAGLVAVSDVTAYRSVLGISLLDGSSGDVVAELSGDSTVQVIPLGPHVGLVGSDQVLRMVERQSIGTPRWSRRLPGPKGKLDTISVRNIDETAVQLTYSVFRAIDESSSVLSPVLSISDGDTPDWVDTTATENYTYERAGDVVVRNDGGGYMETVLALDNQGRELWRADDARAMIAGSRIFLASQRDWNNWSRLREVDSYGGTPISESFDEMFGAFMSTRDGRAMVLQQDLLRTFDEHFRPHTKIACEDFRFMYPGEDQFYLEMNVSDDPEQERIRLTAYSGSAATVSWSLDLPPGQTIAQMGSHLVVVDHDRDRIMGLGNS